MIRRLLRLPSGDPPYPAGDPASVQVWKPAGGYLRYRLAMLLLTGLPSVLAVGAFMGLMVLGLLSEMSDVPLPVLAFAVAIPSLVTLRLLVAVGFGVYQIWLEMEMLRYVLTDQALRLRRGVKEIEEITLSFANIQNVKMNQGFVQRIFGIADLIVETAGGGGATEVGGHVGRIIGVEQPEEMREVILQRAKAFRGSGVGGTVRLSTAPAGRTASLGSPEAAALLQEIVEDLRAIRLTSPPPAADSHGHT